MPGSSESRDSGRPEATSQTGQFTPPPAISDKSSKRDIDEYINFRLDTSKRDSENRPIFDSETEELVKKHWGGGTLQRITGGSEVRNSRGGIGYTPEGEAYDPRTSNASILKASDYVPGEGWRAPVSEAGQRVNAIVAQKKADEERRKVEEAEAQERAVQQQIAYAQAQAQAQAQARDRWYNEEGARAEQRRAMQEGDPMRLQGDLSPPIERSIQEGDPMRPPETFPQPVAGFMSEGDPMRPSGGIPVRQINPGIPTPDDLGYIAGGPTDQPEMIFDRRRVSEMTPTPDEQGYLGVSEPGPYAGPIVGLGTPEGLSQATLDPYEGLTKRRSVESLPPGMEPTSTTPEERFGPLAAVRPGAGGTTADLLEMRRRNDAIGRSLIQATADAFREAEKSITPEEAGIKTTTLTSPTGQAVEVIDIPRSIILPIVGLTLEALKRTAATGRNIVDAFVEGSSTARKESLTGSDPAGTYLRALDRPIAEAIRKGIDNPEGSVNEREVVDRIAPGLPAGVLRDGLIFGVAFGADLSNFTPVGAAGRLTSTAGRRLGGDVVRGTKVGNALLTVGNTLAPPKWVQSNRATMIMDAFTSGRATPEEVIKLSSIADETSKIPLSLSAQSKIAREMDAVSDAMTRAKLYEISAPDLVELSRGTEKGKQIAAALPDAEVPRLMALGKKVEEMLPKVEAQEKYLTETLTNLTTDPKLGKGLIDPATAPKQVAREVANAQAILKQHVAAGNTDEAITFIGLNNPDLAKRLNAAKSRISFEAGPDGNPLDFDTILVNAKRAYMEDIAQKVYGGDGRSMFREFIQNLNADIKSGQLGFSTSQFIDNGLDNIVKTFIVEREFGWGGSDIARMESYGIGRMHRISEGRGMLSEAGPTPGLLRKVRGFGWYGKVQDAARGLADMQEMAFTAPVVARSTMRAVEASRKALSRNLEAVVNSRMPTASADVKARVLASLRSIVDSPTPFTPQTLQNLFNHMVKLGLPPNLPGTVKAAKELVMYGTIRDRIWKEALPFADDPAKFEAMVRKIAVEEKRELAKKGVRVVEAERLRGAELDTRTAEEVRLEELRDRMRRAVPRARTPEAAAEVLQIITKLQGELSDLRDTATRMINDLDVRNLPAGEMQKIHNMRRSQELPRMEKAYKEVIKVIRAAKKTGATPVSEALQARLRKTIADIKKIDAETGPAVSKIEKQAQTGKITDAERREKVDARYQKADRLIAARWEEEWKFLTDYVKKMGAPDSETVKLLESGKANIEKLFAQEASLREAGAKRLADFDKATDDQLALIEARYKDKPQVLDRERNKLLRVREVTRKALQEKDAAALGAVQKRIQAAVSEGDTAVAARRSQVEATRATREVDALEVTPEMMKEYGPLNDFGKDINRAVRDSVKNQSAKFQAELDEASTVIDELVDSTLAAGDELRTNKIPPAEIDAIRGELRDVYNHAAKVWANGLKTSETIGVQNGNRIFFDYIGGISSPEQYLKIVSPYTTWQLRNIPYYIQAIMRNPWLGNYAKTYVQTNNRENERRGLNPQFFAGKTSLGAIIGSGFGGGEPFTGIPASGVSILDQGYNVYQRYMNLEKVKSRFARGLADQADLTRAEADYYGALGGGIGTYNHIAFGLQLAGAYGGGYIDPIPQYTGERYVEAAGRVTGLPNVNPANLLRHALRQRMDTIRGERGVIGGDAKLDSALRDALIMTYYQTDRPEVPESDRLTIEKMMRAWAEGEGNPDFDKAKRLAEQALRINAFPRAFFNQRQYMEYTEMQKAYDWAYARRSEQAKARQTPSDGLSIPPQPFNYDDPENKLISGRSLLYQTPASAAVEAAIAEDRRLGTTSEIGERWDYFKTRSNAQGKKVYVSDFVKTLDPKDLEIVRTGGILPPDPNRPYDWESKFEATKNRKKKGTTTGSTGTIEPVPSSTSGSSGLRMHPLDKLIALTQTSEDETSLGGIYPQDEEIAKREIRGILKEYYAPLTDKVREFKARVKGKTGAERAAIEKEYSVDAAAAKAADEAMDAFVAKYDPRVPNITDLTPEGKKALVAILYSTWERNRFPGEDNVDDKVGEFVDDVKKRLVKASKPGSSRASTTTTAAITPVAPNATNTTNATAPADDGSKDLIQQHFTERAVQEIMATERAQKSDQYSAELQAILERAGQGDPKKDFKTRMVEAGAALNQSPQTTDAQIKKYFELSNKYEKFKENLAKARDPLGALLIAKDNFDRDMARRRRVSYDDWKAVLSQYDSSVTEEFIKELYTRGLGPTLQQYVTQYSGGTVGGQPTSTARPSSTATPTTPPATPTTPPTVAVGTSTPTATVSSAIPTPTTPGASKVASEAKRQGLNDAQTTVLLRMVNQESGGEHYSAPGRVKTSSAGALGIMQLMPPTAQGLGVDPRNEDQNIRGGVAFFKHLVNYYKGNLAYATAAYNAGPGRVDTAITELGDGWVQGLPGETREYLRIIQPTNLSSNVGTTNTGATRTGTTGTPATPRAPGAAPVSPDVPTTRTHPSLASFKAELDSLPIDTRVFLLERRVQEEEDNIKARRRALPEGDQAKVQEYGQAVGAGRAALAQWLAQPGNKEWRDSVFRPMQAEEQEKRKSAYVYNQYETYLRKRREAEGTQGVEFEDIDTPEIRRDWATAVASGRVKLAEVGPPTASGATPSRGGGDDSGGRGGGGGGGGGGSRPPPGLSPPNPVARLFDAAEARKLWELMGRPDGSFELWYVKWIQYLIANGYGIPGDKKPDGSPQELASRVP